MNMTTASTSETLHASIVRNSWFCPVFNRGTDIRLKKNRRQIANKSRNLNRRLMKQK